MTLSESTAEPVTELGTSHPTLAELRSELEAVDDKTAKAILADAIGRSLLLERGQEATAVRELLASYNHDPSFRPPLFALVDAFEHRRSYKNLARLYEAEVKSAVDDEEKIDAWLDRASFLLTTGGSGLLPTGGSRAEVEELLAQVLEAGPERAGAWAIVETLARHLGSADIARRALEARAKRARDPRLRAVLFHEAALECDDPASALALLEAAAEADPADLRVATALEDAARVTRRFATVVDALERRSRAEGHAARAAALACEASALARTRSLDARRALEVGARAVELAPEDPLVWLERAEAAEAAEAWEALDGACERVLALLGGELGELGAVFHLRRAEAARRMGRADQARHHLEAARAAAPRSLALEVVAESERPSPLEARRAWLEATISSASSDADARLGALAELAFIAAARGARDELDARVRSLVDLAALAGRADGPSKAPDVGLWRDVALAALAVGSAESCALVAPHVVSDEIADGQDGGEEERSRWRLTAIALASRGARRALARAALADPACAAWAPEVARWVGADVSDEALVAEAHEALAKNAASPLLAAAHHAARGRALARAGDWNAAREALEAALAIHPDDEYVRTLLEEVGRASGDVEAVLEALRRSARGQQALASELSATAHLAEIEGRFELARRSAEEATGLETPPVDARLLSLRDALRAGDEERAARIRAELPGPVFALAAALRREGSAREEALGPLLSDEEVGLEAALALVTSPATSTDLATLARRRCADLLELPEDPLADVRAGRPGAWLALADRLAELGAGDAAELLSSHGLRVALLRGELDDDAFLRVADLEEIDAPLCPDPSLVSAEVILDAVLRGESSDLAELCAAHARYVERGAPADVRAAHARLMVAAGRGEDVLDELVALIDADPTDVASADALRVAAREARRWPLVVRACDLLAERATGELRAQLLEEAAAVSMDELDDDEGAEQRCRRALAIDPAREIAYARLHDLLAERGDDAALLDLVTTRLDVFDDPEQLAPLLYEQARLFRGLGHVDEALAAIDNLLLLEPEHVGGLALQVEIHVQRERFEDAVGALRALAAASSAPPAQRRIARLGAAEFLEKKLGDLEGALTELAAIVDMGLADGVVFARMAGLAERAGRLDDAIRWHGEAAARASRPEQRAAAHRKLGELARRQGRLDDAAAAYRAALDAQPDDVEAAEALAEIPVAGDVEERIRAVSVALRDGTYPVRVEHLVKIERVARLVGDWALSSAAQDAIRVLEGVPSTPAPLDPSRLRSPDEARLGLALRLQGEPGEDLMRLLVEVLDELEPASPSSFGANSKDLRARGADAALDLVHALAGQLEAAGDVYVVDGGLFVGAMRDERPFYVVGRALRAPHAIAYQTAFFAAGIRAGLAPIVVRLARSGPAAVSTAFFALAAAAGAPVPGADLRADGLADLAKAFSKGISRRARRVADAAGRVGDAAAVEALVHRIHAGCVRVAVLASGDLGRGLGALTGGSARAEAVAASEAASQLVREWLDDDVIAARIACGWRAPD